MRIVVYISAIVLVLFSACKKYPEDDKRYWTKSPTKRITRAWKVQSFTIDNADSMSHVYKSYLSTPALNYTFNDIAITFKEDKYPKGFTLYGYRGSTIKPIGVTASQTSGWKFTNGKDALVFFFDSGTTYTNSFQLNTKEQNWSIQSLTESKLDIVTVEAKRKIRLVLVPA